MLAFFFIERGLLRAITRSLWAPVITNKRKRKNKTKQTNKPADQRPTPVLFLLQLLLLVDSEGRM